MRRNKSSIVVNWWSHSSKVNSLVHQNTSLYALKEKKLNERKKYTFERKKQLWTIPGGKKGHNAYDRYCRAWKDASLNSVLLTHDEN